MRANIEQSVRSRHCSGCSNEIEPGEHHLRIYAYKSQMNLCWYCLQGLTNEISKMNKAVIG